MSILAKATKGPIKRPHLLGLYGVGGVGKSTWAADAPDPIFLGTDDGTGTMDVSRLPIPETWTQVLSYLDALQNEAHEYKTLVIDTINGLEPLLWAHLCREHKVSSIVDIGGGFGIGYAMAAEQWVEFFRRLKVLRNKMNVICLGHATVKTVEDTIEGERYDRYIIKMNQQAADLWHEAMDCMFFARFDQSFRKRVGDKKARAVGEGKRLMHTEERPGFRAKSRFDLPATMPLDWNEFAQRAAVAKTKVKEDEFLKVFAGLESEATAYLVSIDWLKEGQKLTDISQKYRDVIVNRKNDFVAAVKKHGEPETTETQTVETAE